MTGVPRVALLFGGQSPEHEVSIRSAAEVASALDALGGERPTPIYIRRDGKWLWSRPSGELSSSALVLAAESEDGLARRYQPSPLEFAQALLHLTIDEYAAILIVLHGANGEDGRLQGALELAGLRFSGSGSAASALAMDKTRCQAYFASRGLPVPRFVPLQSGLLRREEEVALVLERIGVPCVVKPALCGSSVGLTIVLDRDALGPAIDRAFEFGPLVQVEEYLRGREFTCGVLETEPGRPVALPPTEIVPPEGRFFDYDAKYTPGVTREVTPAEIPEEATARIRSLALEAHRAAGCEGFSRVDFMCMADAAAPGGLRPYILEVNTIPGMTGTSLLPQGAAAAGYDMKALVALIVAQATARACGAKCE